MDRFMPKFFKYKYKTQNKLTHSTDLHKDVIDKVLQKKDFTNQKVIEDDLFSCTLTVHNNANEKLIVKIVKDEELGKTEKQWLNLNHHHILPLNSYEYLQEEKLHLFHSTMPYKTLKDIIAEKNFRNNPDAIEKLIMWFKQASSAVKYIHNSGYSLMNISSKSIAITQDETVKVKDFGYLQHGLKNNSSNGVPSHVCPPEAYSSTGRFETGYGEKFDVYCFGMMMLETLTGSYVQKKLSCPIKSWIEEVYPILFKALKEHKFKKLVSKQYRQAAKNTDLTNIRMLLASILQLDPGNRPNMNEIFLKLFELTVLKDFLVKPVEDEIWQKMVPYKELKCKIEDMALKNTNAVVSECCSVAREDMLTDETNADVKIPRRQQCFEFFSSSKQKEGNFLKATDKIVVVKPRHAITDGHSSCSQDHEGSKSQSIAHNMRNVNFDKEMMGDHAKDLENKESMALSFEHEDLSLSEISAEETLIDDKKIEKPNIDNLSPFDEVKICPFKTDDEMPSHSEVNKNLRKQFSEIFEYNPEFKFSDLIENEENEKSYVAAIRVEKEQKRTDSGVNKNLCKKFSETFENKPEFTESKESVTLSFEHSDLNLSEISSAEFVIDDYKKVEKLKKDNPIPFDKDDEKICPFKTEYEMSSHSEVNKNLCKQFSEIFEYNREYKDFELLIENEENEKSYVTEKRVEKEQKRTDSSNEKVKTVSTVKQMLNNALKWVLDEYFYIGVRNNGSFINQISENLTG